MAETGRYRTIPAEAHESEAWFACTPYVKTLVPNEQEARAVIGDHPDCYIERMTTWTLIERSDDASLQTDPS